MASGRTMADGTRCAPGAGEILRLTVFTLAICCVPAICVPAIAQFSGLATPGDGSRVYFATVLRQKNTIQPVYGKLFTVDPAGLKLFLSRDAQIPPAPAPGTISGTPTNPYDLQAASVSADGKVFAASAIRECVGAGSICTRLERYFTTIGAAGQDRNYPDRDYPGDLRLSASGAWAFGASTGVPGGQASGYLVNVTTGQQTKMSSVSRFQVASSGRPVADDGTAVYADDLSLVVVHGSGTRRITPANQALPTDAVIDRAGATIVFTVCANISTTPNFVIVNCGPGSQSLRLADPSGSGSSLLVADGFAPALSDDGKTLLYRSTRTGSAQIRIANLNGGATLDRQLGFAVGGIARAILSGDGSTVYAVTTDGRLEKISVATRAVLELIPRTPHLALFNPSQLAPGKLVALAGGGLTDFSFTADPPLPETLNGISVTIQGVKARILGVAPGAITVLVPPASMVRAWCDRGGLAMPVMPTVRQRKIAPVRPLSPLVPWLSRSIETRQ